MKQILFFMDSNPVLNGDRIVMRKITKTDAQDMYDYAFDPEVTRYLLWQPHESLSYTKRYLDEVMRQYKAHNFFDFAIVCKVRYHHILCAAHYAAHDDKREYRRV